MAVKGSVFVATSVDGYLARPDGGLDWLPQGEQPDEDYGYAEFYGAVDVVVMGRRTFETASSFSRWPYTGKTVVIWSRGPVSIPAALEGDIQVSRLPARELMGQLEKTGYRHAYVDGGLTIQSFLAEGLVQGLTITRVPVVLGTGIPLFGPLERDIKLRRVATTAFPDGLVQTRYTVEP